MNGPDILALWAKCAAAPDRSAAFSDALFSAVPYSGTTDARVEELSPGHVRVSVAQQRAIENHLNSIHAVALTNVGELASGLALLTGLPEGMRAIVVELTTSYRKKARGTLSADCRAPAVEVGAEAELEVEAPIRDGEGDVVAVVTARWRVGPVPS